VSTAVVYCRVSKINKTNPGVSLEAQESRAAAWAAGAGRSVDSVHVDRGISGGRSDNRPALQAALTRACQLKCPLVVYSLSRLARSVRDTLSIASRLDTAGADLVSLSESLDTTSAAGKMMFRMLAVLAEFERDLVGERTRMALAHLRSQGRKTGGGEPFGFRAADGHLIALPAEQATVARAVELRAAGLSLRAVSRQLALEGRVARTGKAFNASQVKRVLARAS
jgi:DNA invertase Pin-like site-specific DNA recombinase